METYYSNIVRRWVLSLRLKAQYIWYLGIGLLVLLILFAVLYIIGINTYACLALIIILGTILFMRVYKLSNKYGEHGMMKQAAKRIVPHVLKSRSRKIFMPVTPEGK